MEKSDAARIAALLEEIRDRQAEQLEIVKRQAARTERIQDRAEELQAKSAGVVATARRALAVVLPIVILLVLYLSWLIFR
ncbi:MAG TPA: hypothetical protein VFU77_02490 [Steroidobacteraceae bacterium]|nr:hypothetical protein [Steroidobacteraceae bacterium]